MKWKTITGKIKNHPVTPYRTDFKGKHGSGFSKDVLDFLYIYWRNDVVLSEYPVAGTRMRFDFVNLTKKIILETDGTQHDEYVPGFFHRSREDFKAQIKRDLLKDEVAKNNGFVMIRIKPDDLPLSKEWMETTFGVCL